MVELAPHPTTVGDYGCNSISNEPLGSGVRAAPARANGNGAAETAHWSSAGRAEPYRAGIARYSRAGTGRDHHAAGSGSRLVSTCSACCPAGFANGPEHDTTQHARSASLGVGPALSPTRKR